MKKFKGIVLVCFIIFVAAGYVLSNMYQSSSNKSKSAKILEQAYEEISILNENDENEQQDIEDVKEDVHKVKDEKNSIILENDIIGVLLIPKLNIEAPVKEGTSQEVMKTSVGHFVESDYWNGNVSFASHNGGTNAHYFENIHNLKENDQIEYLTRLGKKQYKVNKVFEIDSTDWSEVNKSSDGNTENTITLITCINGYPKKRLCVKGSEIKI